MLGEKRPDSKMNLSRSLSFEVLVLLAVATVVFVLSTIDRLPEVVATHFGTDNRPNGWMTRNGYLLFTFAFGAGVSALVIFCAGFLPRIKPQWTNIPRRDYWLALERREESLSFLAAHACWLACLMVLFIAGIHALILLAHQSQPPLLPLIPFLALLGGFLTGVAVWTVKIYCRFPPRDKATVSDH